MKKISVRLLVALGAFALSAVWMLLSLDLKADPYSIGATTRTFPILISALMLIFSAIICVQEFMAQRKSEDVRVSSTGDILRVAGLIAAMIAYVFLLTPLGFVVSSILLLVTAMLLYGFKNKLILSAVAILFPVFLKLLFEYALKVQLP